MRASSEGVEMSRQYKVYKRKKDRLIDLPEGILYEIISKLTLKEAVKTSSLSKYWRFAWTCHPRLLFDFESLLFDRESIFENLVHSVDISNLQAHMLRIERCKFIERVDQIMNQRVMGPKIDSLIIRSNLGQDYASHLTRWVQYAVLKEVEEINLNLSVLFDSDEDDSSSSRYEFCFTLLASSENECTVKLLRLTSCSLSPNLWPNCLKSLVTVVFQDVKFSDIQLKSFLMICPSIEWLTLSNCQDLVNIEVAVGLRLNFLRIASCLSLMTINIHAEGLDVLSYTGQWVNFSFKSVPRLNKVFLSFTGVGREEGVGYALSRLAHDVPQLETLNLVCLMSSKDQIFAENAHPFSNIQDLLLTLVPFSDEDELIWISYILKAFPMLQKLQINLFSPSYVKPSPQINRRLPEAPHGHLNCFVVSGFNGYAHELELVEYVLKNAIALKILAISQWKTLYRAFGNFEDEKPSPGCKLSDEIVEWLHKTTPPTVDVRIRKGVTGYTRLPSFK